MGILASTQITTASFTSQYITPVEIGPTHRDMTDKNWTEKGIEDSVEGKATDLKGRIKDAAGSLTGDTGLEAEGKMDQLKGKVQDTVGKIERKIGEETDDRV